MFKSLLPIYVSALVQPFPIWISQPDVLAAIILQLILVCNIFKIWVLNISNSTAQSTGFLLSFDWGAAAQRPITSLCEGDYCLSVLLNKSVWWATMDQYTRTTWGECNRLKSLICNFFFFQMCSYVGLRRSPYRSNKEKLVRRRISPLRPH